MAFREKTEKLTPPASGTAPSGWGLPGRVSCHAVGMAAFPFRCFCEMQTTAESGRVSRLSLAQGGGATVWRRDPLCKGECYASTIQVF